MIKEYYLCEIILDLIMKKYSLYPSLNFLKNGIIPVHIEANNLKQLRIYNTEKQFLHFRGIELWKSGTLMYDENLPSYQVTVGKNYKDSSMDFSFGNIVNPYMIHTVSEIGYNYAEITFDSPIDIDKIVIYPRLNRNTYIRANCIAIDIADNDYKQITVFSYQQEIWKTADMITNDLLNNICSIYFSSKQIKIVAFILLSVINESFYEIKNSLLLLGQTGIDSFSVKKFFNDKILKKKSKQFNMNWGCQYTFNLWSEDEKRNYIKTTLDVIELLRPISDNIFYAYGTLLGFIREPSGFIPYDSDIDIIVVAKRKEYPTYLDLANAIRKILEEKGASIPHFSSNDFHVIFNNSKRFDIFFRFEEEDGKIFLHPKLKNVYMTINECYPNIYIDILGYKCPIPKNPFIFLDKVYGNDWRIPMDKNIYKKEQGKDFMISQSDDSFIEEALPIFELTNRLLGMEKAYLSRG